LFPFLAFMVEDLGHAGPQLGIYAGLLAASFCGSQFCSSIFWGRFSDRYGRKPAIVLGTLGAAVGMLVFGLSNSYPQAIAGRMLSGFLSGNLGVLKSFLTEITDETNRPFGFSLISLAWSIGCIMAPLAGGWLCKPCEKYPSVFGTNGTFVQFPYLLPCITCVAFNIFAAILCMVFMVETVGTAKISSQSSRSSPSGK
jgi:MFS family permease